MQDTSINRLGKIISSEPKYDPNRNTASLPRREIHIGLEEGWFSLILLAIVIYSSIWSIQAADWVDHLSLLSLTTGLGLVVGVVVAKQKRWHPLLTHCIVVCVGILIAFWQTSAAFFQGNSGAFVASIHRWAIASLAGGIADDDSIFLLFILVLGFVLAYASAWLLYRARNPWLLIVANAVVLLVNLSSVDPGFIIFLVVFLMASLLLLLRFNLYESMVRWRRHGLRYPDGIGWDVMQAGALISVGILVFSWVLPGTYMNGTASQIWNSNSNPWQQAENTWNRIISLNGGSNPSNHGNFRDSLTLGGNPNLNHDTVLTFSVQGAIDNEPVYLSSLNYDTYIQSRNTWTNNPTDTVTQRANDPYASSGYTMVRTITQKITIVSPLNEEYPYVLGASDITSYTGAANILTDKGNGSVVAWVGNSNFNAGAQYTIVSTVSAADVLTLRTVPLPVNAPQPSPEYDGPVDPNVFDPNVVSAYTNLPSGLDPRIAAKAKQITSDAHATNMYDEASALESYFRNNYTYNTNIQVPEGQEAVSWFLFDNTSHQGFCNYFSTSMVIMARELGIPARVVAGYTDGTYNAKTHQYVVQGVDAHSWVQVYFAGYGWVNFEPSANFTTFLRPSSKQVSITGTSPTTGGSTGSNNSATNKRKQFDRGDLDNSSSNSSTSSAQTQIRQQVGTAFGSIILVLLFSLLLFTLWWRRLFRKYSLSTQLYGRLCLLANWAGIRLEPSQTPYEYIHGVAAISTPQDTLVLERLGDIYVREKWADPESSEHPVRSGEIRELPSLWRSIQPKLFLYVLRHPSFLLRVPRRIGISIITMRRRRKARKALENEL